MIIAGEMGAPLRLTSGPAITHAGDLAAILSGLNEGDVLFVDEIHRMSRPAEEMLYMAMEDFRVDVVIGKGPGATAIPLEIPPFTLVGATTRAGLLPGPAARPVRVHRPPGVLRGRRARPDRAPLRRPARRRAARRRRRRDRVAVAGHPADRQPAAAPGPRLRPGARRRRGHPRRRPGRAGALRGRRARPRPARPGGARRAVPSGSAAGRSGISTLAVAVGEERETVEEVAEPFLVRSGFLARTPRGRVATPAAWEHLGLGTPSRRTRVRRRCDSLRGLI